MRRMAKGFSYGTNNAAFPPVLMTTTVEVGGEFSIYASVVKTDEPKVYREDEDGECSSATECKVCEGMADQKTGIACVWAQRNKKAPVCISAKKSLEEGYKRSQCTAPYAAALYLGLGGSWSCSLKDERNAVTLKKLLKKWSDGKPDWVPSIKDCSEACYFSNTEWAGWTGVYALGMFPGIHTPSSLASGRKYPLVEGGQGKGGAFYCEGFKMRDEKCVLFTVDSLKEVKSSSSVQEKCFINKDNPNPCALGSSDKTKWVVSASGAYYFVVNNEGVLEYIENGEEGPSKCGTSNNVFKSGGWPGYRVQKGSSARTYMPNPANTCSDDTCKTCVAHMLTKSMVRGMLPHNGKAAGQCALVTASKVVTKCDGQQIRLSCASGEELLIGQSFYGRQIGAQKCEVSTIQDKTVPTSSNEDYYKNCWEEVTPTVAQKCSGKKMCTVNPSQAFVENDTCKNLFSYMQVEYSCVPKGRSSALGK